MPGVGLGLGVHKTRFLPRFVGLLDQPFATGATAAYSLRRLKSTATKAVRVREDNGNTEIDIGFSGGALDTTALLNHVGSNNGFVTKWYDQSGNSNDASNPNASGQPTIVSSGVVEKGNGNPLIRFYGTSDQRKLDTSAPFLLNNTSNEGISIGASVYLFKDPTQTALGNIFRFKPSGSNNTGLGIPGIHGNTGEINFEWSDDGFQVNIGSNKKDDWTNIFGRSNDQAPVTLEIFKDGTLAGSGGVSGSQSMNDSAILNIGSDEPNGGNFDGGIGEIILYDKRISDKAISKFSRYD